MFTFRLNTFETVMIKNEDDYVETLGPDIIDEVDAI